MKYLSKLLVGILVAVSFSACDDFLERNPIDELGEGSFYSNTEELNMATIACYSGLRNTLNLEWRLTEIRSDNSRIWQANSTSTDTRNIMALDNYLVETVHPESEAYWEAAFKNVDNCNRVINYINNASDEDLRKQFEGEVRFIRGYLYFNLVRLYGPMFIVDQLYSPDEANLLKRSSVEDVYAFIEDDLTKAIELLPATYTSTEAGRVTSWAAKVLLAKVYITINRAGEAKTLLDNVRVEGPYGLESTYARVFSTSNEMNKEIIFGVRYKAGGIGQGSPFANFFAPANSLTAVINYSGEGFNCPTEDLIKSYEANDTRKDVTLSPTWTNGSAVTNVAYVKKFYSQVDNRYDAENDWIVLRYADVLLMLAEVDDANRLQYLNEVRARAGVDPLDAADFTSEREWFLAIEKERRMELAFENHRYFDLLRTGRLVDVMELHYNTEVIKHASTAEETPYYTDVNKETYLHKRRLDQWQLLLPVPNSVINVAVNATQNPGY